MKKDHVVEVERSRVVTDLELVILRVKEKKNEEWVSRLAGLEEEGKVRIYQSVSV